MSRGLTINCSMIEQDGDYSIGFHYEDTEGVDIDHLVEGENLETMIEELTTDVISDYLTQVEGLDVNDDDEDDYDDDEDYISLLEQVVEDLTAENESLKTDNKILQKRADDDAAAINRSLGNFKETRDIFNKWFNISW